MAFTLADITTSRTPRPPRVILTGIEKIGKSTFAAGAPSPIFLPIRGEEGIDDLDVPRFPTLKSYDDVMGALQALAEQEHQHETVVIDSGTTLEPLLWDHTCKVENAASIEKVGGGFGKGYIEALKYWRDLMEALDYLRAEKHMGCVIITHVAVRTFQDPTTDSYDQYQIDLNKHAAAALMRWADFIGFAAGKTLVKKEETGFNKTEKKAIQRSERVLYTQKRPAHPGGGRGPYGKLPYELPLEWGAFMDAVVAVQK